MTSPAPFWMFSDYKSKDTPLIKKKKKTFRELQDAFVDCFVALIAFQKNKREYKGIRTDAMVATGFVFDTKTKEGKHPIYQRRRARIKAYTMLKDERTSRKLRDRGLVYVRAKWQYPTTEKQHEEVRLHREFRDAASKGFLPTGCTECPKCGFTPS